MPGNGYFGLPRSGKSYEVVKGPVCDAVAAGRRVVTNIEGINSDIVRDYVHRKRGIPYDRLGVVTKVDSSDIVSLGTDGKNIYNPMFLPHYGARKEIVDTTFVKPGDLVVFDEAWKLFPAGERLHPNVLSFFAEHGHFVHPETGVACDFVFMTQALELVHRNVKAMCAFIFETHRKAMFGAQGAKTYSVTMWEGNKATNKAKCGNWVKRYDPEIFALYKSFAGDAGKLADVDSRQNVLKSWKAILTIIAIPTLWGVAIWAGWYAYHAFMGPASKKPPVVQSEPKVVKGGQLATTVAAPARAVPSVSEKRIVGTVSLNGDTWVAVADRDGLVTFEPPGNFVGRGVFTVGTSDGEKVVAPLAVVRRAQSQGLFGGGQK